MAAESDSHSSEELLAEAAKTRQQAARFRQAVTIVNDDLVEMSLRARAEELEQLAKTLEAQAAKKKEH